MIEVISLPPVTTILHRNRRSQSIGHLRTLTTKMSGSKKKPATDESQLRLTATDPVCGMTFDPATARGVAQYQGDTYSFCSPGCMHRFTAEPAKYLASDYKPGMLSSDSEVSIGPAARTVHKDPVCGMTVDASRGQALPLLL